MNVDSVRLHVRMGGRLLGPLTPLAVTELIECGRIAPTDAISEDRKHWTSVREYDLQSDADAVPFPLQRLRFKLEWKEFDHGSGETAVRGSKPSSSTEVPRSRQVLADGRHDSSGPARRRPPAPKPAGQSSQPKKQPRPTSPPKQTPPRKETKNIEEPVLPLVPDSEDELLWRTPPRNAADHISPPSAAPADDDLFPLVPSSSEIEDSGEIGTYRLTSNASRQHKPEPRNELEENPAADQIFRLFEADIGGENSDGGLSFDDALKALARDQEKAPSLNEGESKPGPKKAKKKPKRRQ